LSTAGTAHRITFVWSAISSLWDTPFPWVRFLNYGGAVHQFADPSIGHPTPYSVHVDYFRMKFLPLSYSLCCSFILLVQHSSLSSGQLDFRFLRYLTY
jgi:hypothetical protein